MSRVSDILIAKEHHSLTFFFWRVSFGGTLTKASARYVDRLSYQTLLATCPRHPFHKHRTGLSPTADVHVHVSAEASSQPWNVISVQETTALRCILMC